MKRTRLFPFAVGWYGLSLAAAIMLALNWEPAVRHVEAFFSQQTSPTAEIVPEDTRLDTAATHK